METLEGLPNGVLVDEIPTRVGSGRIDTIKLFRCSDGFWMAVPESNGTIISHRLVSGTENFVQSAVACIKQAASVNGNIKGGSI